MFIGSKHEQKKGNGESNLQARKSGEELAKFGSLPVLRCVLFFAKVQHKEYDKEEGEAELL